MIKTNHLNVFYNENKVLTEIQIEVKPGKITGIIGPNGAGKSTLIKAILNIISHSGEILINGEVSKKQLKKIAYVEQKSDIDHTFPIKVKECVSLGTYTGLKLFQKLGAKEWSRVSEALQKVNLLDYENRQIGELSGGQFQRVLLARCLVQEADYIFLDEPFVGIDSISEKIIMDILQDLKHQGKTILIVHHDLSKVKEYFDDIIILNRELIAYGPINESFSQKNLKKAYGDNIFIGD
ncbi:metal ABC transporter ATP-binding protein [Lactococcus lactis]|jgi:iron/zinc/copper transport system ATP-binding protein|uniref:Iron/zinc/copper transport system ATP-binding protein n=2 Tax=Lactococcus lactis TaxID=1358 RepID=A0AAW5TLX4_9LACT|nr:metal ABC transporter ATP-binding protein [Lactococcus lactis]KST79832.1 Manganese ABC transporter ATP-binding protein SitB [Lactococcus lactis subsp. lactis]MCC4121187.1 metal ABC transporter ATP-binding protein [Lactococcus lactis]MCT0449136.1 metal ABC transporter ATP-binding protein [Lactococcus lactis subsp. lactis]MCT3091254.1 metal ABC transporter ATP-binding protein [Lactococcus lactis]MCW2279812.1 iron/zinc/copper transport system ATP-binding protein [Lactococcus lactis]